MHHTPTGIEPHVLWLNDVTPLFDGIDMLMAFILSGSCSYVLATFQRVLTAPWQSSMLTCLHLVYRLGAGSSLFQHSLALRNQSIFSGSFLSISYCLYTREVQHMLDLWHTQTGLVKYNPVMFGECSGLSLDCFMFNRLVNLVQMIRSSSLP